jgi:hypothetical protein
VDFQMLQNRLLSEVRARVRNGEMTERGLARTAGISQPHIHNVLKGARVLSLEATDRVLRQLGVDLADLLAGEDITAAEEPTQNVSSRAAFDPRSSTLHGGARGAPVCGSGEYAPSGYPRVLRASDAATDGCRGVPLLDGFIGRGYPYPKAVGPDSHPFPAVYVDRLCSPIAARAAPQMDSAALFTGNAVLLLDRLDGLQMDPAEGGYFTLELGGGGAVGRWRPGEGLCLWNSGGAWEMDALPKRIAADRIRARICLVVRDLRRI